MTIHLVLNYRDTRSFMAQNANGITLFHTFGESNTVELRIHFQKSLLERMDVFNVPC